MLARSPVVHLSRRYRFSASHRLHVDALGNENNRILFGKCNNPFGHGHNYAVQVTLSGPVASDTGMIVDLAALDAFAQSELLDRFDCTNLNQDPAFHHQVPSTEHLCFALWDIFCAFSSQRGVELKRLRVEETRNNAFDYFGTGSPVALLV